MIQFQDVEFFYPQPQNRLHLSIPEFHMETGEHSAIIGPSGYGKTTFLNLVSGILKPHRGVITVDQFEVSKASEQACRNFRISRIGFIFQNFELIDYLTVEHNILFPYYINHSLRRSEEIVQHGKNLMQRLQIEHCKESFPKELSQGEQQRVCIARALITRAPLIIADEPTGNLDPETSKKVMDILQQACREQNATLLMVTHDYSLLERFAKVYPVEKWSRAQ
ncbi:MAG: ABC transporter ATP-binding protein [Planctomycetota bacterium]